MKKSLLFIVPLAVTSASLFSCNKKDVTITYDDASAIVSSYPTLVKNDRAKDLHVTGNVNSFNFRGDFQLKTKPTEIQGLEFDGIDIDLKDTIFNVARQKLAKADIPVSLIRSYIPGSSESRERLTSQNRQSKLSFSSAIFLLLPTLPFNEFELYLLDGFKVDDSKEVPIVHEKYTTINTTYHKVGDKLRIDVQTDDMVASYLEIAKRTGSSIDTKTNIKVPGKMSVTLSELGYMEDFSFSFKTPEKLKLESGDIDLKNNRLYLYIDANIEVDVSLHFGRDYYKTVNINYELVEYEIDKETGNLIVKKEIAPSTNLKDFEDYFTVEWYSYSEYDDPLFKKSYWSNRAKNIAYEYDNYDALIVPSHRPISGPDKEWDPKYDILGTNISGGERKKAGSTVIPNDLCSISYNGYLISESDPKKLKESGVESPFVVKVNTAEYVYDKDKGSTITATNCADAYIPAKFIKDANGEYIVSIAVMAVDTPVKQ